MAQIVPQRRPHYGPVERMAILELRAPRGWSLKQTADTFLVTPATISAWVKRIDENGPDALLQLREPVNKFPDFVRYIVQRLKILNPAMGKVRIAETLCRAGLHVGVTTVGRILKEAPLSDPEDAAPCVRITPVLAVLLVGGGGHRSLLPTRGGLCSIALVERFILSLKNECTRVILVPLRGESFRRELVWYADWFNQNRPHSALGGKTPHEVYHHLLPACERPRFEPRARWPRSAPCAFPHVPVAGYRGTPLHLDIHYHTGRRLYVLN